MQLKTVLAISVRHLIAETLREVDDLDGLEGTLLHTHSAPDAKNFRYD